MFEYLSEIVQGKKSHYFEVLVYSMHTSRMVKTACAPRCRNSLPSCGIVVFFSRVNSALLSKLTLFVAAGRVGELVKGIEACLLLL